MALDSPNQPQEGEQITRRDNSLTQKFRAWCEDVADAIGVATVSFLGLTDTPNSYAGQAGNSLVVNPGETALEFGSVAAGGLPPGYKFGLDTRLAADADHDITIAVGTCRDALDTEDITLSSELTKRIDADWVEGDNNGGLATGARAVADTPDASTTYHYFLIFNGTTVDAGWDTDIGAANLLADATGYTEYRRIASHLIDVSNNITAYTQFNQHFYLDVPIRDVNFANANAFPNTLVTLSVPIGIRVFPLTWYHIDDDSPTTNIAMGMFNPDIGTNEILAYLDNEGSPTQNMNSNTEGAMLSNTSGQLRMYNTAPNDCDLLVTTTGWIDPFDGVIASGGGSAVSRSTPFGIVGTTFGASNISLLEFRESNDTVVQGYAGMPVNGSNVMELINQQSNGVVRLGTDNAAATGALEFEGGGSTLGSLSTLRLRLESLIDFVMVEKADHASTPAAGLGLIWVRNDSPNVLMFTDDAGTDFVIGGAATPGWQLLETNTIAGSPANIDLTWDESLYSDIRIVIDGIQPATDGVTFRLRLGDTDGTVIHATAADYDGIQRTWQASGVWNALAGTDRVDLAQSTSNAANELVNGTIELFGSRDANSGAGIVSRIQYINNTSDQRIIETKAFLDDAVQASIDTVRLFFASGNFANTGDIKLYGLRR